MNESDLSIKRPTSKSQQESLARIVKAQVTLLVSNLDNDNFTRKAAEIHSLIETHGEDIRQHLFRYLLSDLSTPRFRLLKDHVLHNKPKIMVTKSIYENNIQQAPSCVCNKQFTDSVFQYLFESIIQAMEVYQFNVEQLESLVSKVNEACQDKSLSAAVQLQLDIKSGKHTTDDGQFKQNIIDLYNANPSCITRILDMTKNKLPSILDTLPTFLALDLACAAAYQKSIHLESWLRERMDDTMASQCLDFLAQRITIDTSVCDNNKGRASLSLEAMSVFLKVLSQCQLNAQNTEQLKEVQNQCLQTYPKLMNVRTQAAPGSTGSEVSFKPDVEEEANLYYERIYNGELSLDDMIEVLKRLSTSNDTREQDVFACMIHNLFDEYLFFPKYPEKELLMTSILFGSLIQHRLVSYVPLGIALRYVLDALRNPIGSKMFNFGVQALLQFKSRLTEWPQYCAHLLELPDLAKVQPDLIRWIQAELQVQLPFTCIHVPAIPNYDITYCDPSEATKDKILFILNNVAQNNIESKMSELQQLLQPSCYRWFSHYLVATRISSEPNYHELYVSVLDAIHSKLLNTHILTETFENIRILLNSDKTVSNSTERTLLKNLGSWLGRLTLAKNKPILHKHIPFKDLLLEGYDTQRLIVVIPFACKVLEQCAQSKVFRPPNPWLLAILKLMVELYEFANLKLNLKFEIEVLCKSLSIGFKDVKPTSVLKNRQPQAKTPQNTFATVSTGYPGRASVGGNPLLQNSDTHLTETQVSVPNLAPYISFNSQIALYTTQPAAKRLVLQAFTESIREIIGPVVERSVAISVVSTRDLVSKDFVMEMDENKMRKAAHMMAQNLAVSLAMVTSKEPLRLSIVANLRTIFLAHGLNDSSAEQAIILTVADNLDLLCAVIEKAAMEKVTVEIDEVLSGAFAKRKKHRDQRPGQPFVDMDVYQMSGFQNMLPQRLRPKPNGLLPSQLSVYEDFIRIPCPPAIPSTASTSPAESVSGYGYNSPAGFDKPPNASAHLILERFAQCISELEKLVSQTNVSSFHVLPQHSDIRTLVRQIPMLALSSFDKSEVARTFAQKVVQLLYKSDRQLLIEVYVVLLERLCEVSPTVGTLVTSWLTHADDERKYNVPVTVALIKAGLIDLPEQDRELSILIESGRASAIEFTARLIRACLFTEPPLATRREFMASLDSLRKLRQVPDSVMGLMDELSKRQPEQEGVRDQLQFFFGEWVRLCQHPATTEKTMLAFATQLGQQATYQADSSFFYRVCIEASVDHVNKFKSSPGPSPAIAYQPIDAFSSLLVTLMQVPDTDQVVLFNKVLSVIVLVMAHHHELGGPRFDQRPFLRLFSSILADLRLSERNLRYTSLLIALGNTFYTLQPIQFTGFAFSWLQLISHRFFMPQLLLPEDEEGWPVFQRLLICLFRFLAPYLRQEELGDTVRLLYRGTLRVLLILLHDFPEFVSDYHNDLCDVIPSTCIQLRNLVLSAFPRSLRLPDPFTPSLKIDLLPEIHFSPRVLSDSSVILKDVKKDLDLYLQDRKTSVFLKELLKKLKDENGEYNVPLLNAVVFYVGIDTIIKGTPVHQGPPMEIYQYLLTEPDSKGRYLFLNAIANQLRFPNSHTHYFSCVLLYLFIESDGELYKEQITRVLLERLIVNRPHPWGLLITFIELVKNPRYNFWSHSFTSCATDIERLFESVSR
ncbi:hypothetical protein HPULCUR_012060 [Helicostylum pulchrum]|uniref:Not1 n=1 Tax=Helicostylum pulchrum TaxID=562976 RepID=A0ABP9YI45_9FUNG